MLHCIIRSILSTSLVCATVSTTSAQLATPQSDSLARALPSARYRYPYESPLTHTLSRTLPMLGLSLAYNISNHNVAQARSEYLSQFHSRYDDFLQFAPLAVQGAMHLAGVQGRSLSTLELATADALSAGIMMSVVTLTKTLSRIERPDGSARNSFPSGHTAMAFASATMLHLEYGERYPLLSALGYGAATGVGLGRMLNNRHWLGDVTAGAFVGILSAELGYWLSDRIHRRGRYERAQIPDMHDEGLYVSLPWRVGFSPHLVARYTGLGFRWRYDTRGYFAFGSYQLVLRHLRVADPSPQAPRRSLYERAAMLQLGWGREWRLVSGWLSWDTALSVGLERRQMPHLSLHLGPRLYIGNRCAVSLDMQYGLHYHRLHPLYDSDGARHLYRRPSLTFGSTLELHL